MTRRQCSKCPWKVSTDPYEIPNGYSVEKHHALSSTIAHPVDVSAIFSEELRIMACHETHKLPCVGWLVHQLGRGNNLALRMAAMAGRLDTDVETVGQQYQCLEDTFPRKMVDGQTKT